MFPAALYKLNDNPPPTCAVLVSQDSSTRENLAEVCESIGVVPVIVGSARDAAGAVHRFCAPLVIVFSDHLQISPLALFEALRPNTPRLVMFGPRFGGVEHVLALELGFHEVWPVGLTPLALNRCCEPACACLVSPGTQRKRALSASSSSMRRV